MFMKTVVRFSPPSVCRRRPTRGVAYIIYNVRGALCMGRILTHVTDLMTTTMEILYYYHKNKISNMRKTVFFAGGKSIRPTRKCLLKDEKLRLNQFYVFLDVEQQCLLTITDWK